MNPRASPLQPLAGVFPAPATPARGRAGDPGPVCGLRGPAGGDGVARSDDAWMRAPVSSRSRFGDDVWHLDIHVAGRRPDLRRVAWNVRLPDGSRLTDPRHAGLLGAAKQFLWSMAVDPPCGYKRPSQSTLHRYYMSLRVVIGWMLSEGLTSFRMLDAPTVQRLCAWLRTRPGRRPGSTATPATVRNHLAVIAHLYRQRRKLDDAPKVDPLDGEFASVVSGATRATLGKIPFIPDALAVHLLSAALVWVEAHAEDIVRACGLYERIVRDLCAAGANKFRVYETAPKELRRAAIPGPDGKPLVEINALSVARGHLLTACFVLIAGFVGMRVSEILSMQVGAVASHPIGETGVSQAYIEARLFKTAEEPEGRIERWLAPGPVVHAVKCIEELGAPLRAASGYRELFLVKDSRRRTVVRVSSEVINRRLNLFAAHVGVPPHEGKRWVFSSHQFRKTFARFVARHDRSQLLVLADHFKHVSVAMTSRGYVGTDLELHELIDEEARAETALALDRLLSSDRLGGRMGERIAARNHAYRGRAGEQVRRDYIDFVLDETDLRIRGCDYGWCVFQAELALCGGEVAPNEAGRAPSVCAKCANLALDDRHVPYWRDRRQRNQALLERATNPLVRAVLVETIEECDRMLRRIEGGRDGGQAEPGTPVPDDDAG